MPVVMELMGMILTHQKIRLLLWIIMEMERMIYYVIALAQK